MVRASTLGLDMVASSRNGIPLWDGSRSYQIVPLADADARRAGHRPAGWAAR